MIKKNYVIFVWFFFLLLLKAWAQPNFNFNQRATWDGPFDIKMVSAPNLQPVFIDETEALAGGGASGRLLADSLITSNIMRRTGDLFEINNRYKDGSSGSVFEVYDIPMSAILCDEDPNIGGCLEGYEVRSNNSSCPAPNIRYGDPIEYEKYVAMTYADYDNDMSTFSSSMAELDISSCSEIEAAYLYWTGNFEGGNNPITLVPGPLNTYSGSGDVFNASNSPGEFDEVLFKVPGGGYQNVTADIRYASTRSFVCVADVTNRVNGLTGGGEFWVGNLKSYPIEGNGGSTSGWTLVVIFRSPLSPPRLISLFDGFKNISAGDSEDFVLTGLQAPATANFQSYVGFAALDGENLATQLDDSDTPEGLGFQTNSGGPLVNINPFETDQPRYKLYDKEGYPTDCDGDENVEADCDYPLFDANWCDVYDGVSSSHITTYDEFLGTNGNEITRLPNNINTLGYDAHHMILPDGAVAPGATEATLTVRAGPQGSTMPFMAYLAIERLQPKLNMTKTADKNSTGLSTQLEYSFVIKNEGNAPSLGGDIIYDTLDAATNYNVGSLNATRGNVTLTSSANDELEFEIPDPISAGDSVVFTFLVDVIPYADDPSLFNPPTCKRTIQNTAWVEYNTISSGVLQSKSNSNDCGIGSETRVVLVDDELSNSSTTSIGPLDGCDLDTVFVLDRIREELINAGVSPMTVEDFDIRDSLYNRIRPEDVFGVINGTVKYLAIQDLNTGIGCQEIYEFTFECISCIVNVTSPPTAEVCSGEVFNYTITSDTPGTTFIWDRAAVANISNTSIDDDVNNPIDEVLINTGTTPTVVTYKILPVTVCQADTFELSVTVNALPTGTISLPTPAICPGDTTSVFVDFQNNSGIANNVNIRFYDVNGSRLDSAMAVPNTPGRLDFEVYAEHGYTAQVEHADQGCVAFLDTVYLTHHDSVKAVINNNTTICANGDSTANIVIKVNAGTGPFDYTYTIDGGSPMVGSTFTGDSTGFQSVPFAPGTVTPQVYALESMIDANGCEAYPENLTGMVTVTPVLEPIAGIAQNNGNVLAIAKVSADLADDNTLPDGYDRLWVMDPNGSTATLTSFSDSITTAQNLEDGDTVIVVLQVSDENGFCRSDQDSIQIVKIDITLAEAENDTLCYTSGTINHVLAPLTIPNTSVGENAGWEAVGAPASSTTFTTNAATYALETGITAPGVYTYKYTITNSAVTNDAGDPISSSATIIIVVDEAVIASNAGLDTTICANNYQLNAIAPTSGVGHWNDLGKGLVFTDNTLENAVISGYGVESFSLYWVIESDLGICPSDSDEVIITNTGALTVPDAGIDTTICSSDLPFRFSGNQAIIGETVLWSGLGTITHENTDTASVHGLAPGSYGFTYTISNGVCPDLHDSMVLTLVAPPSSAEAGDNDTICGDSYQLQATAPVRGTGRWEIVGGSGNLSGMNNPTASLSAIDSLIVLNWITTSTAVCPSDTDQVIIRALDFVTPQISLVSNDPDDTICKGTVVRFTATPINGGAAPDFSWRVNGSSAINAPANYIVNNLNQSINTVEVTMTPGLDVPCPSAPNASASIQMVMLEPPSPVIVTSDAHFCENQLDFTIQGNASTSTAIWYKDGQEVKQESGNSGAVNYLLDDINDAGTYQLYENNGVCPEVYSTSVTVDIDFMPYVDVEGGFDALLGDVVTIKGHTNAPAYQWEAVNGGIVSPNNLTTDVLTLVEGINEYTLKVENGLCRNEATLVGFVRLPVEIPNVFTPNNDGDNDYWKVLGLQAYPNMSLKVFNRWGNIVYKNDGEFVPWDGKRNGNEMPIATYYYVIELNEEGYDPVSGSVTIVR